MKKRNKIIGVIPARLKSKRLPEKLLLEINNKPLVWYTYMQIKKTRLDDLIVAVDHRKLFDRLKGLGCKVVMTSSKHKTGTDRVGEVALKNEADFYINIQGDEPLIKPGPINKMIDHINKRPGTQILTIGEKITRKEDINNPDIVKVVCNKEKDALYFSRSPVPYDRDRSKKVNYIRHIGIYCFRNDILRKIVKLAPTGLEKAEKLEQLRFLENGYKINLILSSTDTIGVDTPGDFLKVKKMIEKKN